MIDAMGWILTALAITGAILNARRNVISYYLWIISNIGFVMLNLVTHNYYMVALFAAYLIICLYGLIFWSKQADRPDVRINRNTERWKPKDIIPGPRSRKSS